MARPVLTPVLAMAVGPGPLRLTLIGAVVGVTVQLALLPAAPALTLTGRQGAITLMGNLRTRPECPVACRAPPALHGCVSAHKKRRAWATQSVDDNHADVHRDKVGRKQVSGSIPMSKAGSIVVSVEADELAPDRMNRRRHVGQLRGTWSRSSPVAAKRGVADAGLEGGHEPR